MSDNNPQPPQVSPFVFNQCEEIVRVFFAHTGDEKRDAARSVYTKWLASGDVGPRALNRFIGMLSKEIDKQDDKVKFVQEARKRIKLVSPKHR
jgi:hypothetical protein